MALRVLGGRGAMLALTGIFDVAAYSASTGFVNWEFVLRSARGGGKCCGAALGRVFRLLGNFG